MPKTTQLVELVFITNANQIDLTRCGVNDSSIGATLLKLVLLAHAAEFSTCHPPQRNT